MPEGPFNAVYNATEVDGKSKLEPADDALLYGVGLKTVDGRVAPPRTAGYIYPSQDGAGTQHYGLNPSEYTWELMAATASAANRRAFLDRLDEYKGKDGRYELKTERGDVYPYVELRDYKVVETLSIDGGGWWIHLQVLFEDMQPGAAGTY